MAGLLPGPGAPDCSMWWASCGGRPGTWPCSGLLTGPTADLLALLARSARGDGRVFAGSETGWGTTYRVGYVPVYAVLANHDIESIGYWFRTSSMSTAVEPHFDEQRLAHYSLFDVRYVVVPVGRRPQVSAEEVDRQGRHVLYRVGGRAV